MASPAKVAAIAQRLLDCCSAPPHGWSNAPIKDPEGNRLPSDFERKLQAWVLVLEPLSDEELSRAGLAWARGPRSAFMPSPGELLQLARPATTDADLGAAGRTAWGEIMRIRGKVREHNGHGYRWRSDEHERRFRQHIGPVAWAALETIGGILAIERAGFLPDDGKELSGLESRFVADFRTISKRTSVGAAPEERPQIGAAPVRMIAADGDLHPSIAQRINQRVGSIT